MAVAKEIKSGAVHVRFSSYLRNLHKLIVM
jgi:hypothetical protein